MRRTRRQASSPDGTRICWSSAGSGAPPVLLADGIGCAGFIWRRLAPALARERRVLHFCYRGHGQSGAPRDPSHATVGDCVADLLAVLDAAGERRAVLMGHSMGVQVALETHRRAPGRVAGLVLLCGAPGRVLDTFHGTSVLRDLLPYVRRVVDRWPALARAGFRALVTTDVALEYALAFEVNRALLRRGDLVPYFRDLARVDPVVFLPLLASAAEHDASDHLREVRVPTLVVAGARDAFTPMQRSLAMHRAIEGSDLLVLSGGTHVGPLEYPELVEERVRSLLAAVPAGGPPPRRRPARRPVRRAARKPTKRARAPRPAR